MNTNQKVYALFAIGVLSALLMNGLQYQQYSYGLTKHPQQLNKDSDLNLTLLLLLNPEDMECTMKESLMYLRLAKPFCST